uniref:Protein phosphatase methylesterase-1 n=1 Tax=Chloropicon laureae TaxID=464258 RepID=A0A7S3DZ53_9CHLO
MNWKADPQASSLILSSPTFVLTVNRYSGLSKRFLGVPVPKLLLLAGTDRLDKDLTIGQMQGKFQMKVLPAGHAIHEDEPDKFCEALDGFLTRFRIA